MTTSRISESQPNAGRCEWERPDVVMKLLKTHAEASREPDGS